MNRNIRVLLVLLSAAFAFTSTPEGRSQDQVHATITRFEQGLEKRNLSQIASVVAPDIVVFENGGRNTGWIDFRDHHLIPEFHDPAPQMKTEFVKAEISGNMAWAYTRSELTEEKAGKPLKLLLWSIYVLQKDAHSWKIHMLDWSIRRITPD